MSPLVALLAFACASPLLAASVRRDDPLDNCANKPAEIRTRYAIPLQRVQIAKNVADAKIDVADNCALANMKVVGQEVVSCDCLKPPNIVFDPSTPFTPVLIHRNGNLNCAATIDITQYCT